MNRAVFLDRDNTIIANDGDLGDPAQVQLIQGAASAIASLRGLGYRIIVVSNQGGVARGKYDEAAVQATNNRVNELIKETSGSWVDRFYYCPYHPQGTVEKYKREHPWRKPQPGMILQAAKDLQVDLTQSWMVGDQMRDVEAGAAAGVRTVLLSPKASEQQPPLRQEKMAAELFEKNPQPAKVVPDFVARNLVEAVRVIAQQRRPDGVEEPKKNATLPSLPVSSPVTGSVSAPPVSPPISPPIASPITPVSSSVPASMATAAMPTSVKVAAMPKPPEPVTPAAVSSPAVIKPASSHPQPNAEPIPVVDPKPVMPTIKDRTPKSVEVQASMSSSTLPQPTSAASESATASVKSAASRMVRPDADMTVPAEEASGMSAGQHQTLRQILQELRNHRPSGQDRPFFTTLALVLQTIAIVCLLGALWLGQPDIQAFMRWSYCALFFQLTTIASLLVRR